MSESGPKTMNPAQQQRVNSLPEQPAMPSSRPQGTVNHPVERAVEKPEKVNLCKTERLTTVHASKAVNPSREPAQGSVTRPGAVNPKREPGKGAQVQQFIRAEVAAGHIPTLDEIIQSCRCSRNTAIRSRRTILEHLPGQ